MIADESAYRALGLEPGAAPAAVDAAYRTLIKRFHPDRSGGDAGRAAEINWAYGQIRKAQQLPTVRRAAPPAVQRVRTDRPDGRLRLAALAIAIGAAVLVADRGMLEIAPDFEILTGPVRPVAGTADRSSFSTAQAASANVPLDSDAIDRSVMAARQMVASGDDERLAAQSRRCHQMLHRDPSLARLDQCIAFDEAVVLLKAGSPWIDRGQFSGSALTGRQLGAARLLSSDYLALESRFGRIRSRVEFTLAPADPMPRQLPNFDR